MKELKCSDSDYTSQYSLSSFIQPQFIIIYILFPYTIKSLDRDILCSSMQWAICEEPNFYWNLGDFQK